MFTWSESNLFSAWFCFCTIIIKVCRCQTSSSCFHWDVVLTRSLYDSSWLTHVTSKQATQIVRPSLYSLACCDQRSRAVQVLRQVTVFERGCASCRVVTAEVSQFDSDSNQAEPPTSLRAIRSWVQRTQALPLSLPARAELRSLSGGGSARSRPLQPRSAWETLSSAGARPPTRAKMPKTVRLPWFCWQDDWMRQWNVSSWSEFERKLVYRFIHKWRLLLVEKDHRG